MLRRALLVIGVACLVLALVFFRAGALPAALELCIAGVLLTAGILFERWRYVRPGSRDVGHWEATGERFVNAAGKRIQVYYNPETGERDYREE